MASYPNTGTLFDSATVEGAKTRTALSTQIVITVNGEPVGAVQRFNESQRKATAKIKEVGTDGIIEIVPSGATDVSLTVNRMVFDGLSLPEAFSRGFRNIQAQRIPFDIVVIDRFTGTGNDAVVTTYHNCWFESLSKNYSVDNYTIAEDATIAVEYMSTERAGEAVGLSQGVNGTREIPNRQIDSVELAADSGRSGRRGSLDFPGLISAAY
jgi:hypothetical protein